MVINVIFIIIDVVAIVILLIIIVITAMLFVITARDSPGGAQPPRPARDDPSAGLGRPSARAVRGHRIPG